MQRIERKVVIDAPRSAVWHALTTPAAMRQWMGEPEMRIEVVTDWRVGSPIVISGFHHAAFRNSGIVLRFDAEQSIRYTHLNSVSRLPDEPRSYSVFGFELESTATGTLVTLTIENFPTDTIFRHLDFYWRTTLELLGRFVEQIDAPQG